MTSRHVASSQVGRRVIAQLFCARDLETESLFSVFEAPGATVASVVDLGLRLRGASPAPLYVIDLNVLFDVIKDKHRPRSPAAGRLIAAALAHQIRLAVAPEFIVELERHTTGDTADPILRLARQLPRLPVADIVRSKQLADLIHTIVFVTPRLRAAGSPQAWSDARHLAQAALAGASGYVTSDGGLIAARDDLVGRIGIDVASLDEFDALLPATTASRGEAQLQGIDCVMKTASVDVVRSYLEAQKVAAATIAEFVPGPAQLGLWKAHSVSEDSKIVGIGLQIGASSIDAPARILVHVRPDHVRCETFADYLLDIQCREACGSGPVTIELLSIPGQSTVRRAGILRGFMPLPRTDSLIKVAVGRPITPASWISIARQTRRRTGLRLPDTPLDMASALSGLTVQGPEGKLITVRLAALEDAIGPTILVWPGREGVVVPIARRYADDLLGTGDQLPLFGSPEAAFMTRRTYFNTPRSAPLMRPGTPMLFYESRRSGGRGAIVAVARIVDATILPKEQVPDELLRRAVVEDLEPLSASLEVLATSFDNLLRFPKVVGLDKLRGLGAIGASNLQTATALGHQPLARILELGWARA
jgi:predicted nucleic acid-binding protein